MFVLTLNLEFDRVDVYGKSIVNAEGNEWRRHIAVVGPAFSEANYMLTWKETLRIVNEWLSETLRHQRQSSADDKDGSHDVDVVKSMMQTTLHVIASAGFGIRVPWVEFGDGHTSDAKDLQSYPTEKRGDIQYRFLPFSAAMHYAQEKLLYHALIPDALQRFALRHVHIPFLSHQLRIMKSAFASLEVHMKRLVEASQEKDRHESEDNERNGYTRKGDTREEYAGAALLRRLVQANDASRTTGVEGGGDASMKKALTDGELFSNIFASTCRPFCTKNETDKVTRSSSLQVTVNA